MNEPEKLPPIAELPDQLRVLQQSGAELARRGLHEDAERIFRELLKAAPRHLPALHYLAGRALARGDLDEAQNFLERAIRINPDTAMPHQNLGIVLRARGFPEGALLAFDTALRLRPDLTMAWVQRGDVLQALGRREEAIAAYQRAENLSGDLRALLRAAGDTPRVRESVRRAARHLARARLAAVSEVLAPLRAAHPPPELDRVEQTIRILCRAARPVYEDPLQRPAYAYVPGLPAQPFFARNRFPFLASLERESDAIRAEMFAVLAQPEELRPYVEIAQGLERQWKELNHSPAWSAFHLYRNGERVAAHCARCPATTAAVEALPLVRMQGHAPEIFFSILRPGTHIPPHFGIANYKLAVHLPLVVPPQCAIRVGEETQGWTPGKCLIFDDSFEHEAWNRSAELRVVLIFEVWNPALGEAEREALSLAHSALDRLRRRNAKLAQNPPKRSD
ncbi:MAG TPA: aspartyl/asparaginyl beta-hydroxylase domain-containing protein [Gammaproteobacteria bacterium]|nr:aspartyl/asparaginyl beta-hydroxylase domain-containing protein [Gammaproteobacteria bacterium]